jgi:hypothetical protein
MPTIAAAGSVLLLAVLWLDLMFDVQSRKHAGGLLPTEVLASISAYYRRVTTEAYPMNRLVALVSTLGRTVPNARRLGRATDTPETQSALARAICRDHLLSFARTSLVLGLQLMAR